MTMAAGRERRGQRYEFLLAGELSETVRSAFPELTSVPGAAGGTVLFGEVEDMSHLRGLLDRFQTMGLTILEMRQLPY